MLPLPIEREEGEDNEDCEHKLQSAGGGARCAGSGWRGRANSSRNIGGRGWVAICRLSVVGDYSRWSAAIASITRWARRG